MAEYLKRSHFFADFSAEGTVVTKQLNPIVMGRREQESTPDSLGTLSVSVDSSRFHNGNELFESLSLESGLFIIRSIQRAQEKIVTPLRHHAQFAITDSLHVYGTFIHLNPSGYTHENLAHGMSIDPESEGVLYEAAKLTIHDYSDPEPKVPVVIQKLNALPKH